MAFLSSSKSKKSIDLRLFTIFIVLVLGVLVLSYKYFEWLTINNLQNLYNSTWTQELSMVQDGNKSYLTYNDAFNKTYSKNATNDSIISNYEELAGSVKIIISHSDDYLSAVNRHSAEYSSFPTWFLFGSQGDFVRKLVADQKQYYSFEIEDSQINSASNWLLADLLSVLKDKTVVGSFNDVAYANPTVTIPKYFPKLSPLEKYTHQDFKFDHEEDIKKYYPNGYDLLIRYKDYLNDYYSTIQDYVNGEYLSASYKFPALQTAGSKLNVDFANVLGVTDDHENENAKEIIKLVTDEASLIKDYKGSSLTKYPILSAPVNWKENLVLCQMYDFKTSLYHKITSKYVLAKDFNSLLDELSSVPPDTKPVDGRFDKSVIQYSNNDKNIQFVCTDKATGTNYTYVIVK